MRIILVPRNVSVPKNSGCQACQITVDYRVKSQIQNHKNFIEQPVFCSLLTTHVSLFRNVLNSSAGFSRRRLISIIPVAIKSAYSSITIENSQFFGIDF